MERGLGSFAIVDKGVRTPSELSRTERLWAALFGAGGLVGALVVTLGAVLGAVLGASVAVIVGAVVVLVGGIGVVVLAKRRNQTETTQEKYEADRVLNVPPSPVNEIDPTGIGVDLAVQSILPGTTVPEYVLRSVDNKLREAVEGALNGTGSWIVVVMGPSKVGKSRSLFEALRHQCDAGSKVELYAPADGNALKKLLRPGEDPSPPPGPAVLWLDDLELFLSTGIGMPQLQEWHSGVDGRIVVGTYGGKGSDQLSASDTGELAIPAKEVLGVATEVPITETTNAEIASLHNAVSANEFEAIKTHGLAAYLVAGAELKWKLSTRRHGVGAPECPEGAAVVRAAVDWARTGRTDPIPPETLQDSWSHYLPAHADRSSDAYGRGLAWARKPVAGSIALLLGADSYRAYDYVVRLTEEQGDDPPLEETWRVAVSTAADVEAFTVGVNAYLQDRPKSAEAAFRRAWNSDVPQVAADAGYNLGVTLTDADAKIAVYDDVVARFGDDPTPAVRTQVAEALFNKAVTLTDADAKIAVYDDVVARFGDDPTPAVRAQVAKALVNKARTEARRDGEEGRSRGAADQ